MLQRRAYGGDALCVVGSCFGVVNSYSCAVPWTEGPGNEYRIHTRRVFFSMMRRSWELRQQQDGPAAAMRGIGQSNRDRTRQFQGHRPLHTHVAALLRDREDILDEHDVLSSENGRLKAENNRLREELAARNLAAQGTESIEEECRALEEAVHIFGRGSNDLMSENRALKAAAEATDDKVRVLMGHLEQANTSLHKVQRDMVELRRVCSVEVSALSSELELHDGELGRRDLQILASLGDAAWLREKLTAALSKQHSFKRQLQDECMAHAESSRSLAERCSALEAELRLARDERLMLSDELAEAGTVRDALANELKVERGALKVLRQRMDEADEARVDALVYADRADHELIHGQASAQRASRPRSAPRASSKRNILSLQRPRVSRKRPITRGPEML